jgi:hypothetical protein
VPAGQLIRVKARRRRWQPPTEHGERLRFDSRRLVIVATLARLARGFWHNEPIGEPGRHFAAYAH